jgi:hypothetical protein
LLQLDAPNRRATSLPHYLLSLLAPPAQLLQPQQQTPEAQIEQAEGGQQGAEESHQAPEQEEAQVRAY